MTATRDALLHFVHFVCIFSLVSLVVGELFILRASLPADLVRRMQLIDRWYGITAGLVIVSGLALLNFGAKGAAFYTRNPVFWTKMGLFVAVALLSIAPTVAYLRLNGRRASDGSITLANNEYARIRGFLFAQIALIGLIPLCAALMANGV